MKHINKVDGIISDVYLMDNMELMAKYEDNYFDLAVVDPPYGIDVNKMNLGDSSKRKKKDYKKDGKEWDLETPSQEYFDELVRVSKNQIIWGANYMIDKIKTPSMGWIYWNKKNGTSDFSDGELAFTSFNRALRSFEYHLSRDRDKRFHPTQKPVYLYDWIFKNYATEGMKILDTHLGSQSSRISAHKNKMHFIGCELDPDYFADGNKRFDNYVSQLKLF
jgi:site-specific DNA-methyltransferase (adenine-specific)